MGRPRNEIAELNSLVPETEAQEKKAEALSDTLEITEKDKAPKERTEYKFQQVGNFPKDSNGVVRYPTLSLSNSQSVYDKKTGSTRQARVLNGVATIWQDEQDKIPEKTAQRLAPDLKFVDGMLRVPAMKKNIVDFLMLCSDFEGCENPTANRKIRYRLLDTEADEAKILAMKMKQKNAIDLAWKASVADMKVHFQYLGGSLTNDYGEKKSDDGIRTEYVKIAEDMSRVPLFLKTVNNPIVKMHMLVQQAFKSTQIIMVDGQILWADTKKFICQIPPTHQDKPADYLAEMMLSQEGRDLRVQLQNYNA